MEERRDNPREWGKDVSPESFGESTDSNPNHSDVDVMVNDKLPEVMQNDTLRK